MESYMMAYDEDAHNQLFAEHAAFIANAGAHITADISAAQNGEYISFLSLLLRRIRAHEEYLQASQQAEVVDEDRFQWGPIRVSRNDRQAAGIVLEIQGPAAGDQHHVSVESTDAAQAIETQLQDYDKMSISLARAYRQEQAVSKFKHSRKEDKDDLESSDPNRVCIALLKQLNDIRDLAQQLMGIIADDRGVPVRDLYTDEARYGVGPHD